MKTLCSAFVGIVALVALFNSVYSAPVLNKKDVAKAAKFFLDFGYIQNSTTTSGGALDFKKALRDLQKFGGLPVTGELNQETLTLIGTKRCGMKDPVKKVGTIRKLVGEFYLQGSRWEKKYLTYRFVRGKETRDLPVDVQQNIIRRMINKWDEASSLTIREAHPSLPDDQVDILISFVYRNHGDPYYFDGEGGTLAHAFYPHDNKGLSGDAHFDDDERYTTGTKDGINLDWVALHEIGHSLGLEHSNVRESVMYPWYKGYQGANIELTNDDIMGIRALYGAGEPVTKKSTPVPPTTPSTKPSPTDPPTPYGIHPACKPGSRYNAVVMDGADQTHFFQGETFWTLDKSLRRGDPKRVRDYWPDVRTPINAAYRNRKGNVVFFAGNRYWEYNIARRLVSSSSLQTYGLSSDLANMDAVFTWSNKKTYFFKGSLYWRYNEKTRELEYPDYYPQQISKGWPDLGPNIDAAVTWRNKRSYIFSGEDYLRLQKASYKRKVYKDAGYPKDTAQKWMKCNFGIGALQSSDGI